MAEDDRLRSDQRAKRMMRDVCCDECGALIEGTPEFWHAYMLCEGCREDLQAAIELEEMLDEIWRDTGGEG